MNKKLFFGHFCAVFTLVIWGTTFMLTKTLAIFFTPMQILLVRFSIAYVVLFVLGLFSKPNTARIKLQDNKLQNFLDELMFFCAAFFGMILEAMFEIISMRYTYTANTSVITSTNPFFIGLASAIFLNGEKPKFTFYLGFVLALAGAAIIGFNGATEFGLKPIGDVLAFGAPIAWATYTVIMAKIAQKGYATLFATRRVYFWATLIMFVCNFIKNDVFDVRAFWQTKNLLFFLFLGIFASGLGFLTWNVAASILSPVSAGVYLYLTPIVTVICGIVFLHEKFNFLSGLGIVTVILGTVLASKKR